MYNEIVFLTAKIEATGLATKAIKTAETGDSLKVNEVFENFKNENSKLYERIITFKKNYEKAGKPTIFAEFEENIDEINMFEYDSSKIHPLNFYFFVFVTGLKETDFFEEFKVLIDSLEKEYPKFATYFWNKEIKYPVGETLVKIFED